MRIFLKIVVVLAALSLIAVLGLAAWLTAAPPALIRVASGYTAKIVCSNVFVAGRKPDAVLRVDVQAPGHPVLKLMRVEVDQERRTVEAALLGLFGKSVAVARDGLGCASVPDGQVARAASIGLPEPAAAARPDALWPEGNRVELSQSPDLMAILNDPAMTGPDMRALVVVENGRIVGERYANGFSAETPLLGWSMTKTVTAALVGTLVADGRLALERKALLPAWEKDGRGAISIAALLAMQSGLAFNEDYGDVTDVTRMLYLEPDMAAFAAAKPLVGKVGATWSYSSGTSQILSRLWQQAFDDPQAALAWPRKALFGPLGMASAVLETDEAGTFVGSSYLYATARDWARFGQFLLQDGMWDGARILPAGFAGMMREPVAASNGDYAKGSLWLRDDNARPGSEPPLPTDTFWLLGHDGQSIAVVPSRRLVVVRLGLTPSRLGYSATPLVASLAASID